MEGERTKWRLDRLLIGCSQPIDSPRLVCIHSIIYNETLSKIEVSSKIVFFVGNSCVTLGQTTPSHTPMRQKKSKFYLIFG